MSHALKRRGWWWLSRERSFCPHVKQRAALIQGIKGDAPDGSSVLQVITQTLNYIEMHPISILPIFSELTDTSDAFKE